MAPRKKPETAAKAKKTPVKKAIAKKTTAKKAPAKKAPAKKAPAKKITAKKAPAKKTTAKKAPAKKTTAKKAPVKKTIAKKAPTKKAPAKKTTAKKTPAAKKPKKAAAPRATAPAPAAASLPAATASNIGTVNPVSGLQGSGHVLNDSGEVYDVDLAFSDAAANSNKFYRMQVVESNDSSKYWMVQHWGRIGTSGQNQVKEFGSKAEAIKALDKKFKQKSGVSFAQRGAAGGAGLAGKYHTLAEQRVAAAGGRMADDNTICFCLAWDKQGVDLDLHCVQPDGTSCSYQNKSPNAWCNLDVDKMGGHYPNQVENIFLNAPKAPDGDYKYFVRYYNPPPAEAPPTDGGGFGFGFGCTGNPKEVSFQFTFNQLGKTISEGTGKVTNTSRDQPCVTLTMKGKKVSKVDFVKECKVKKVDTKGK
jgi:predicted DNA-binding WGR domain protein